jgi:hypothetical protein
MISSGQPLAQEIHGPLMDLVEARSPPRLPLEQSWIRFSAEHQPSQHTRGQSESLAHKSRREARFSHEIEGLL